MITMMIQLILAPVVMVTACAILLNGLLGHYAAINDRLRAMSRERIGLLRMMDGGVLTAERLREIDGQMPDLLRRHKLIRDAVLTIYLAILIFIVSMFVIAVVAATNSDGTALAALIIFLAGTATLLVGVLLTAAEVSISHWAIQYEARRILALHA